MVFTWWAPVEPLPLTASQTPKDAESTTTTTTHVAASPHKWRMSLQTRCFEDSETLVPLHVCIYVTVLDSTCKTETNPDAQPNSLNTNPMSAHSFWGTSKPSVHQVISNIFLRKIFLEQKQLQLFQSLVLFWCISSFRIVLIWSLEVSAGNVLFFFEDVIGFMTR